jgi:5'(3')-deoxyribonucleotidase
MKKTVLIDLDGVLVNFVDGACKKFDRFNPYEDESGEGKACRFRHHGNYRIQEIWGIPEKEFYHHLDYDFWSNLDWMPDGREILKLVLQVFEGNYHIGICSSPAGNDCTDAKLYWITKNVPRFTKRFIITPEKHFLAMSNTILIDDRDQHVTDFNANGGRGILVPRPWNSLHCTDTLEHLKLVLPNVR